MRTQLSPFATFSLLLLLLQGSLHAQDKTYTRSVIARLSSPEMYGRGYVSQGDRIAADYLAAELAKWKVKPLGSSYLQHFAMKINGMTKADLLLNGEPVRHKEWALVEASSPTLKGTFPVIHADSKALMQPGRLFAKAAEMPGAFYLLDSTGLGNPALFAFAKNLLASKLINKSGVIEVFHREPFGVVRKHFDDHAIIQLHSKNLPDTLREVSVDIVNEYHPEYQTQNVIGHIKGKSDEWIVFTGHYDGEGMYGDLLFPAASDNASGTAMVIDLARHYATGKKPHYNMAFMLFAGEEAGLHGSTHYVENPLFPLEKIRMVINLDMVGTGQDGCMLFNATTWPEETALIHELNNRHHYLWNIVERGPAANSDHHPFHLKGVPALFFITQGKAGPGHTAFDTEAALPLYAYESLFRLVTHFVERLPGL